MRSVACLMNRPARRRSALLEIAVGIGAIAVIMGGAKAANVGLGECNFHLASQFAGSHAVPTTSVARSCLQHTVGDARSALVADFVYLLVYGGVFAYCINRWWSAWNIERFRRARFAAVMLGPAAALCDAVENVLTWSALPKSGSLLQTPTASKPLVLVLKSGRAEWIGAFASVKWLLFVCAGLCMLAAFAATLMRRATKSSISNEPLACAREGQAAVPALSTEVVTPPPASLEAMFGEENLGVCCSGGGIRAAAYSLGAVQALEAGGVLQAARWLSAVSGGAYTATGWALRKSQDPDNPAAPALRNHLLNGGDNPQHKYLSSGPGGLARNLVKAVLLVAFNVVAAAAAVVTVSWPIGWLLSTTAIQPTLGDKALPTFAALHLAPHHWVPGVAFVGLALFVLVARAAVSAGGRLRSTPVAVGIAAVGVLHAIVFVVLPYAVLVAANLVHGFTPEISTGFGAGATAVAGFAYRAFSTRIAKLAPRLGGWLLGIVVCVFGAWVATEGARIEAPEWPVWLWPTIAISFAVLYFAVPIQWASLRSLYRDGLRRAFARQATPEAVLDFADVHWSSLDPYAAGGAVPELVICSAVQQMGFGPGQIPAASFTISRSEVSAHGVTIPTSAYLATVPEPFRSELETVSGWMAVSGAAFSSAMGRSGMGSTNALMAAFNIDLGAWMPNPVLVAAGYRGFGRIHLDYLVKEIFGMYDPADENVFVSDGGQWENLGLVELFRRGCTNIVCIDASGDSAGTFTTLWQAIGLAASEISEFRVVVSPLLADLEGGIDRLPETSTTSWSLEYVANNDPTVTLGTGKLYYAKLQVAGDQPAAILRYADSDTEFPNYPTYNQFLEDAQVEKLLEIGEFAGNQLASMVIADGVAG